MMRKQLRDDAIGQPRAGGLKLGSRRVDGEELVTGDRPEVRRNAFEILCLQMRELCSWKNALFWLLLLHATRNNTPCMSINTINKFGVNLDGIGKGYQVG